MLQCCSAHASVLHGLPAARRLLAHGAPAACAAPALPPPRSTSIPGLYCVGDSTFPGQGVNAGARRLGLGGGSGGTCCCQVDWRCASSAALRPPTSLPCHCPRTHPPPSQPAVVFSGFGCAHRVLCDLGREPTLPGIDEGYNALLAAVRDRA